MKMARFFLFVLVCLPLFTAYAQDGDDTETVLATIREAYTNTAAATSYAIETDDTTEQRITIHRDEQQILFTSELDASHEAVVSGSNLRGTLAYEVQQSQTVNDGEPSESSVELEVRTIVDGEQIYLDLSETPAEFRPDIPETWQRVGDRVRLPAETEYPLSDLANFINQTRFSADFAAYLVTDTVSEVELLGEDDIDGDAVTGYLLTLDLRAMLAAQAINLSDTISDTLLSEGFYESLLDSASYTLEIWIDNENSRVREQTITLEMQAADDGSGLEGDLAGSAIEFEFTQEQQLELGSFDSLGEVDAYIPLG